VEGEEGGEKRSVGAFRLGLGRKEILKFEAKSGASEPFASALEERKFSSSAFPALRRQESSKRSKTASEKGRFSRIARSLTASGGKGLSGSPAPASRAKRDAE
jgi:hypothetical protein